MYITIRIEKTRTEFPKSLLSQLGSISRQVRPDADGVVHAGQRGHTEGISAQGVAASLGMHMRGSWHIFFILWGGERVIWPFDLSQDH